MNSLVVGNTSQLSYYFPQKYERVSSRNIDLTLYDKEYDRVFLTFAEQRLSEIHSLQEYIEINSDLTLKLINFFKDKANYVIVYGSCELWNNIEGSIDEKNLSSFDFDKNSPYYGYCISKVNMIKEINKLKNKNIIVLHPFNFNSPKRKPSFLFYKIFDSIINRKKITIGDTYFYRDLIHPKYVVEKSLVATKDEILGSGRLTFMNDFIRELYRQNHLNYNDYVEEIFNTDIIPKKKILYLNSKEILYNKLLEDTLLDIKMEKIENEIDWEENKFSQQYDK